MRCRATPTRRPTLETLELELVLADLASVEGRLDRQRRAAKGDKTLAAEVAAMERAVAVLGDGVPVYRSDMSDDEREHLAPAFLLTDKPVLVVVNVGEDQLDQLDRPPIEGALAACVQLEAEAATLDADARASCSRASGWASACCHASRRRRTTCSGAARS